MKRKGKRRGWANVKAYQWLQYSQLGHIIYKRKGEVKIMTKNVYYVVLVKMLEELDKFNDFWNDELDDLYYELLTKKYELELQKGG